MTTSLRSYALSNLVWDYCRRSLRGIGDDTAAPSQAWFGHIMTAVLAIPLIAMIGRRSTSHGSGSSKSRLQMSLDAAVLVVANSLQQAALRPTD